MTRLAALLLILLMPAVAGAQLMAWAGPAQYPSGYSTWISQVVAQADYHAANWTGGYYSDGVGGYPSAADEVVGRSQYEPWHIFRELDRHLGGSTYEAAAVAAGDAWRDVYVVPNSGGITAYALIRHYELAASINGGMTPDTRTVAKIERLMDATWNLMWVAEDASYKYRWAVGTTGVAITDGSPALNNLVAVAHAWLYKQTGTVRHKQRAEAAFNGTVGYAQLVYDGSGGTNPPTYVTKEFHELTRRSFDLLDFYAAGVAAHE